MQTLKLADNLFEDLFDGYKRTTIRFGKRAVVPGPLLFEATNNHHLKAEVEVLNVTFVRAGDITLKQAQDSNYADVDDLMESMRTYYPTLCEDDDLTIIEFTGYE